MAQRHVVPRGDTGTRAHSCRLESCCGQAAPAPGLLRRSSPGTAGPSSSPGHSPAHVPLQHLLVARGCTAPSPTLLRCCPSGAAQAAAPGRAPHTAASRNRRARREERLGTRKLPCHRERGTACLLQASRRAGGVSHRQAGFPALQQAARQAGAARRTVAPAGTAGPSGAPGAGCARGQPPAWPRRHTARWPHGASRQRKAPRVCLG